MPEPIPKLHTPLGFGYNSIYTDPGHPPGTPYPPILDLPGTTPTEKENRRVISSDALHLMQRGAGFWAAYQNVDLSSHHLGHLRFLQYGGPSSTYSTPPHRYPDTQHGPGWAYYHIGYVNLGDGSISPTPLPPPAPAGWDKAPT